MTHVPVTAAIAEKPRSGESALAVPFRAAGEVEPGRASASVSALSPTLSSTGLAPDAFAEVDDTLLNHLAAIEGKWLIIRLGGLIGLGLAGAIAAQIFSSIYIAFFLVGVFGAAGHLATGKLITRDRMVAGLSPQVCQALARLERFSVQSLQHKFDLVLLKIVGGYTKRLGGEWEPDDLTPLLRLQFQQIADAHGVAAPVFERA